MRNFTSKKWLIVGLIMVFLAVALVGCGNQAADNAKEEPQSAAEPVTLLVSAAASLTDAMADIEKAYQEEHSNVSLILTWASGSLQEQIANGAPADVFICRQG